MSQVNASATLSRPLPRADAARWALPALVAGAITIGFSGLFVRWSETGPIATGFYRLGIAGVVLAAAVFAWLLLGERLGAAEIAGSAVILLGIWIAHKG